ncbi:DMT family transporter [Actinopolymorpha sp. B17G11]|uniref:DMT family transporter n=1 Tax=Actinopolymorpha sp. B17G11 TaxID=3160861 RepID=UPI0032E38906
MAFAQTPTVRQWWDVGDEVWIAVPAALGAAASYGAAGVLQHRATHRAPERPPLRPRLLLDLLRLGAFRTGALVGVLGFALQVVALRFGPLSLVQPILVTGVLFYLGIAWISGYRRPDLWLLLGAVLTLAGLCGFLVAARPGPGSSDLHPSDAFLLGLVLAVVVAACLAVSSRVSHEARAVPLAAATAVLFGVTAGLVSSLASSPAADVWQRWELYALIVVGPTGFLLSQNAYQTGQYGSVALAVMTVGDPLVAIGIGVIWLGQTLATGPLSSTVQVVALCLVTAGIAVLAERAQSLAEHIRAVSRQPSRMPPIERCVLCAMRVGSGKQ